MTISIVQTAKGTGTSLSFGSATTAGNCVVVFVFDVNVGSAPSVSAVTLGGSAGNFAAAATASNTGSFDALCTAWADPNCAGGQTALAVTMANSGHPALIAYEISGLAASSVVDKTHTGNGTAASWSSGTTATTTTAAEIWLGGCCVVNTAPTGPASPWSNISQAGASVTDGIAGSQIVSSTGTATYSGTGGGSSGWASVVITLKASSLTNVNLTTAQVTVAAPAPGVQAGPVALPVAQVAVAAPAPAAKVAVSLPVAQVVINALPLRLPVILPTAQVNVAAHPVTPAVIVLVPLTTARVTVAALPVRPQIVPQLLISLASQAGTDDYGHAFPQGIMATEGVIEGPEFKGLEFIVTTSGAFFYSGTPGSGNLAISVVPGTSTVSDPFGNVAEPGVTSYAGSVWGRLTAGQLAYSDGSFLSSVGGVMHMETGSAAAAIVLNDGTAEIDIDATTVNVLGTLNVNGNGVDISATLTTPQARPSAPASAPSSYTQAWGNSVVAQINSIIQTNLNAGIFS